METAPGALLRARKVVIVPAVLLALGAGAASLMWGQQSASGTDDGTSKEFKVFGEDGALPTSKPTLGAAREALSAAEVGYAIHLASTDASVPDDATTAKGESGLEHLYTELPDDVDATTRQAAVTLYDYTGDTAYKQLVDLEKGTVVSSESSAGLQPPTSSDEADVAIGIAMAAGDLAFLGEFEESQGVPLVSPEQVTYVAGSFLYDGTTTGGEECGKQRCAQLMVQAADGAYLNTWDFVVNLSTKSVIEFE